MTIDSPHPTPEPPQQESDNTIKNPSQWVKHPDRPGWLIHESCLGPDPKDSRKHVIRPGMRRTIFIGQS